MKNVAMKSILSAAAISLVAGLSSINASAQGMEETFVHPAGALASDIHVSYLSSELATEEGRAQVQRRIVSAARKVCGPTSLQDAGGLKMASRNRACQRDAIAAASSQIDSSQYAASGS